MTFQEIPAYLQVNFWPGRNGHPIESVVYHVAEGSRSSVTSWFNNPDSEASTQVLVCKDGTRLRYVRDQDTAWANGVMAEPNMADPIIANWKNSNINPNRRTLSVETERYWKDRMTSPQIKSLAELSVIWHRAHGLPNNGSRMQGHGEIDGVNRQHCPSFTQGEWDYLVGEVSRASVEVRPPAPTPNTSSELYDLVTGKYIHPDIWAWYQKKGGWQELGHPLAGAYLYTDGWIRQLFENVVIGAKDGIVKLQSLGQAWLSQTKMPAVQWPTVTALK